MSVISGINVLKKIKNDSILKNIKVIMITSSEDDNDYMICKNLGCLEYLKKPIDYNKMSLIFNQYAIKPRNFVILTRFNKQKNIFYLKK